MSTVRVNGVDLYYEFHGATDGEVLVLSNGVLMSTASWAFQTPVLSRDYRLLLYDCRGMWRSEHPKGPYSMELHADDLAALLDVLGIEKAHIAGISYGGEVSMMFALRYPQRTHSLIVSSAVSESDAVLRGMVDMWSEAARAKDAKRLFEVTYMLNFSADYIQRNREAVFSAASRYALLDMDSLLELLDSFNRLNITDQLKLIEAPTLVMVGEEDILKPRKYSQIIAREIPNAQLVVVPDAGHALCLEKPTIFNALILGFLRQIQGQRMDA